MHSTIGGESVCWLLLNTRYFVKNFPNDVICCPILICVTKIDCALMAELLVYLIYPNQWYRSVLELPVPLVGPGPPNRLTGPQKV